LPTVLGAKYAAKLNLPPLNSAISLQSGFYTKYNKSINTEISIEFSSAAFRFGHSAVQDNFQLKFSNGTKIVPLFDGFYNSYYIYEYGFVPFLFGLSDQPQGAIDPFFQDVIRNRLYQPKGKPFGLDLPTINIRRGREHGIQVSN